MSQHAKVDSADVIRFSGTLDAPQMVRMKSRLTRLLNRHPRRLLLDFGATEQVNLAGLGILVDRLRRLNGHSEILFSNVSPRVHRTLVRAGVNGFLAS
ncbi:MAG: STAS domain-containing protein [Candidatus Omnitrophica bacterium]|nr:STAS domain-containing protein [Candidatus Omnitrophota bacterium]